MVTQDDVRKLKPNVNAENNAAVFALRQRAFIFGYNAPQKIEYPQNFPQSPPTWNEWTLKEDDGWICLDNAYDEIRADSYVVMYKPGNAIQPVPHQIRRVEVCPRTDYGLSTKTTRLELQNWHWPNNASPSTELSYVRDITVYVQSEELELAQVPDEEVVSEDSITLDGFYLGLKVGQKMIVTGQRDDMKDVFVSEVMTLKNVRINRGFTVLTFDEKLTHSYVRNSVTINANVAQATHGKTVEEILGSGDASKTFQRFKLRQPPLTHVSAGTASGTQTTLEIRVSDVLWKEVPTLNGRGPNERIYITRVDNDGNTTVIFGDGKTGARLPTGRENIKAKYRKGIGRCGLVNANQLSQLITMPLGVKSATNPIKSDGAADAEHLEQVRANAPVTVLTLDRIVSLQDFQDFARAFAGIDKALAIWKWMGGRQHVVLTVAGTDGAVVEEDSTLGKNLLDAMHKASDANIPVSLQRYTPRFFRIKARILVHKDHLPEKDGIFAGLLVAEMMALTGKSLSELIDDLFRKYGKRVSGRKSISLTADSEKKLRRLIKNPPGKLGGRKVVNVETIDGLKLDFSDDDWLLFRFSGTEPLLRYYAESGTKNEVERLIGLGRELVS